MIMMMLIFRSTEIICCKLIKGLYRLYKICLNSFDRKNFIRIFDCIISVYDSQKCS
jgi:hypothetical protein